MKSLLKYSALSLIVTFISITAYYCYAIYSATGYTKRIIMTDLEQSQWRQPEGAPEKLEIVIHDLTDRQRDILIKVQDPGFYGHSGIDLSTPGAGLTTITQAIVKKLYFKKFKPGIAKIKQSLIAAFVVDTLISKEDQLTLFINTMFFGTVDGKPAIGLKAAADAYYQKPVNQLTDDQYISLIAMIVMPGTFHIIDHPEWNNERSNRIKGLVDGRYIPTGLMDQFYGNLPKEVINAGLPPASYLHKTDNND